MKVQQLLIDTTNRFPQKPAIIFKEKEISFSELKDTVFRLAKSLLENGVKKSDKVAIFLPNYPEYIYSYLAAFTIGAVVVPLDFMLTQEEIKNFIIHSGAEILIAQERKGVDFFETKTSCPTLKKIILFHGQERVNQDGFSTWGKTLQVDADLPRQEVFDTDDAAIFYTSGSTGHPKGVLLTYGHLDNPILCIDHFLKPTDQDSYLCAGVPFSHIGGMDYMLFMLFFGSTLVLMDRFHPLESLKNLEKYKITIFCIVPAMFIAILSMKGCGKFDLSSLKYPVVFGAPSSPVLLERFQKLCPNAILLNGWGMTETSAPNTYSPPDIRKISSIGSFGAGMEAKIVDDQGREVPIGERGELWIKGPAVMTGYYKEPGLTKQVFSKDGWFKTGDMATKDREGLFYIVGRKKDMIKVAGQIVFASEVEVVMQRLPEVQDVAVIGIPDKLRGEVVKAFVVLKKKRSISSEDLKYALKDYLAHFKIPHEIEFRDDLPRNRTGKIDKVALQKEALV